MRLSSASAPPAHITSGSAIETSTDIKLVKLHRSSFILVGSQDSPKLSDRQTPEEPTVKTRSGDILEFSN